MTLVLSNIQCGCFVLDTQGRFHYTRTHKKRGPIIFSWQSEPLSIHRSIEETTHDNKILNPHILPGPKAVLVGPYVPGFSNHNSAPADRLRQPGNVTHGQDDDGRQIRRGRKAKGSH